MIDIYKWGLICLGCLESTNVNFDMVGKLQCFDIEGVMELEGSKDKKAPKPYRELELVKP